MNCIIPARKGSKRLPNKNTKILCGKPMISWSIDDAIESNCFDQIIVASDDKNIEIIVEMKRVNFFRLPDELTKDGKQVPEVLYYIITNYKKSDFVLMQPTSPVRSQNDIKKFCNMFYTHSRNRMNGKINGSLYYSGYEEYMKRKEFDYDNNKAYYMDVENSIDIDTIDDFQKAEMTLRIKKW